MFYLAGIVITFFLSALLAGKKGKSAADKILTAWLMTMGFHLTLFYLYISGNYVNVPWLLGFDMPLPLVHGPFLFLYTTALTKQRKINLLGWAHFIPAIATYVVMIPFFLLTNEEKILIYKNKGAGYEWLTNVLVPAFMMSGVVYVILSFLRLRKHKKNIKRQFSNTEKINLDWLRNLIYGIAVIWLVIVLGLNDFYVFATVVLFVFFIGYFGIKQPGIFTNLGVHDIDVDLPTAGNIKEQPAIGDTSHYDRYQADDNVPDSSAAVELNEPTTKTKYQKSSLNNETAARLHDQLTELMMTERIFTNPELNLGELAERLAVHPNILSQVINSFENKIFYDYINSLRIEEFKNLVSDPRNQQYTLLSLAYDCGFNSKTAFNRNFKKATGLSPSEYLRQANVNLA